MPARPLDVLFPCIGNSCRGIMAACLLDALGNGRFKGHSAGSHPAGRVNPANLAMLGDKGHRTDDPRGKSWDAFGDAGAPAMDRVITVRDNAAGGVAPVWPGHPVALHRSCHDPAGLIGFDDERRAEYGAVHGRIEARARALVVRPVEDMDAAGPPARLAEIGRET